MDKKLCKSSTDKVFIGVCGGLGEYFGVDTNMIRILWLIAILFFGTGFLAYFILMLLMPQSHE
ncbi:PspC domain-containing protein [Bacillus sp. AFS018417]|uniref:PspC domain-containing protein n=1 Tax=unclassified Bacillus (in: firmicutes) TaxID=185979 RepID=UPI000BF70FD1|nr:MULTISPECIES: PspC domain-containing protein [unclassified Bacillus (in: firmicutes)]MCP1125388.1 PspC domain-containing protein [Bacillus sp. 3103sda1]PEZ10433.1 PspC domain-containing protein [Bacillus sp. AFS018417]